MMNHIKAAWLAYYWEMKNRISHLAGGKFDSAWPTASEYWTSYPFQNKYRNFFNHMVRKHKDGGRWKPKWLPK